MDPLTQGVIGGFIGRIFLKNHYGNRPIFLIGATANIPDLDILVEKIIPLSPIDNFMFHRGMMHSFAFNIPVAIVGGYLLWRWFGQSGKHRVRVRMLAVYCSIVFGHLWIDAFTTYGIRWLRPFDMTTYSFDNVFVVDPFLSIPIGILLLLDFIFPKKFVFWMSGAIYTIAFFLTSFFIKSHVEKTFSESIKEKNIVIENIYSSPEPLNIFLRRGLIETQDSFLEGYYSIFDGSQTIIFKEYKKNHQLANSLEEKYAFKQIQNFSQGMYILIQSGDYLIFDMIKFGGINGRLNRPRQGMITFHLNTETKEIGLKKSGLSIHEGDRTLFWRRVRGI